MGLADDLAYTVPKASLVQRGFQGIGSTRLGAAVFARILPPLDAWVDARTGRTLPEVLAGLPILALTTRGRRSGVARMSHLVAIPHGDGLGIIGTNFGQERTPAWVYNLEADPAATVTYRDRSLAVRARPTGEVEREEILGRAERLYRGYGLYRQRIRGRRIRVFVLEQVSEE